MFTALMVMGLLATTTTPAQTGANPVPTATTRHDAPGVPGGQVVIVRDRSSMKVK